MPPRPVALGHLLWRPEWVCPNKLDWRKVRVPFVTLPRSSEAPQGPVVGRRPSPLLGVPRGWGCLVGSTRAAQTGCVRIQRALRLRLTGVGLYAVALGLIGWQHARYSARFDEVDAAAGYLVPFDVALGAATIVCVVVAWVILRRID